jgi:hypothetical protein
MSTWKDTKLSSEQSAQLRYGIENWLRGCSKTCENNMCTHMQAAFTWAEQTRERIEKDPNFLPFPSLLDGGRATLTSLAQAYANVVLPIKDISAWK